MQAVGSIVRNVAVRNGLRRSYHDVGHFKKTTMNELPSPQGSWKTHYDSKQRKYNAHLLLGVGFLAFSLFTAKASGLVYLNFYPPEKPE